MEATSKGLVGRMIGAATLDIPTYEDVEHDESATGQAALVVALVALAQAIGSPSVGLMGIASMLIGWAIGAGVIYGVGTGIFGGTATWGELLRTLGFAASPGVLYVLGILPILGSMVMFVVGIWTLVCFVVAIRQALDFSTGKAILTALVGMIVWMLIVAVVPGL